MPPPTLFPEQRPPRPAAPLARLWETAKCYCTWPTATLPHQPRRHPALRAPASCPTPMRVRHRHHRECLIEVRGDQSAMRQHLRRQSIQDTGQHARRRSVQLLAPSCGQHHQPEGKQNRHHSCRMQRLDEPLPSTRRHPGGGIERRNRHLGIVLLPHAAGIPGDHPHSIQVVIAFIRGRRHLHHHTGVQEECGGTQNDLDDGWREVQG